MNVSSTLVICALISAVGVEGLSSFSTASIGVGPLCWLMGPLPVILVNVLRPSKAIGANSGPNSLLVTSLTIATPFAAVEISGAVNDISLSTKETTIVLAGVEVTSILSPSIFKAGGIICG